MIVWVFRVYQGGFDQCYITFSQILLYGGGDDGGGGDSGVGGGGSIRDAYFDF